MKTIYLTAHGYIPNEKGKAKIKNANKADGKDQYGHTVEYYEDIGIPIPKDSEFNDELEIDEDGFISLKENEVELESSEILLNLDEFSMAVDEEEYTTVWLKNGVYIKVFETAQEIDDLIKEINLNFFQRKVAQLKYLYYLCRRNKEMPF